MNPRDPLSYWGKARPLPGAPAWHPLPYHCLDVAAALEAILDAWPRLEAQFCRTFGLAQPALRALLLRAAALHDLGKFTSCFQAKGPPGMEPVQAVHGCPELDEGHARSGLWIWDAWRKRDPGRHALLRRLVVAALCHHGAPVKVNHGDVSKWPEQDRAAASAFHAALEALFPLPSLPEVEVREADIWLPAGLFTLADWVGSDQDFFPYRQPLSPGAALAEDLAGYWRDARQAAARAVADKGILPSRPAADFGLAEILGEGAQPTALQDWAARVPLDREPPGPRLALIEDFTGSGKTEAALILAQRLMASGCAGPGLYWALPTQATSNALYGRLGERYRRLFAAGEQPSLALAHADSALNLPFRQSLRPIEAAAKDYAENETPAEAACAAWLADDRRTTFLAEVGVGTLDQALLAVMPARYNLLRLLGLSQRVLVVDEVHGYDPYTNTLLGRLLEFQAALGGSAVLLSATLSTRARQELVARFRAGLGLADLPLAERGFPYAALIGRAAVEERRIAGGRGTRRDLPLVRLDGPEAAEAALAETARAGGCAGYVRNTVDDAIESGRRLQARYPDLTVEVFHARLALGDRQARETEVLARYGKDSGREDRAGHILVATQVVEQSLDLDFDLLASDLAPLDLLIQRAGRLQRHGHRTWRPHPARLLLVAPSSESATRLGAGWYGSVLPRAGKVYPNHARLWAALRLLEEEGALPLLGRNPRDLLDRVRDWPEEAIPEGLQLSLLQVEAASDPVREQNARGKLLTLAGGYDLRRNAGWADEVRIATRYAEIETKPVRLARMEAGQLRPWVEADQPWRAWRLSELRLADYRLSAYCPRDAAEKQQVERLRGQWKERRDDCDLVVLAPGEAGLWQARIEAGGEGAAGRLHTVTYDPALGWRQEGARPDRGA